MYKKFFKNLPNPISSHLQPLDTHSCKPATTNRLNAQTIYSSSSFIEAHWGTLCCTYWAKEAKNMRPSCQTFLMCLLTNCRSHRVCNCFNLVPFACGDFRHQMKSILHIVYSTASSPHWKFCCATTYRAACHKTDVWLYWGCLYMWKSVSRKDYRTSIHSAKNTLELQDSLLTSVKIANYADLTRPEFCFFLF